MAAPIRFDRFAAVRLVARSLVLTGLVATAGAQERVRPNFVVIEAEELDAKVLAAPNLSRMARSGTRFTTFYGQHQSGAAQAALLSGCYPIRCAEPENRKRSTPVLHTEEITLAEVLRPVGYRSACVGRWRVGSASGPTGPLAQGFDEFVNGKQTPWLEAALQFLRRGKKGPVFLYATGVPGRSLDAAIGRIMATLRELEVERRTLLVCIGSRGGGGEKLRGRAGSTWEGGMRVPCLLRWPGSVPSGKTVAALGATMDLLPTLAQLAGAKVRRGIDGVDIWPSVVQGRVVRQKFYYYCTTHLQAVRDGDFKLILPRPARPDWVGAHRGIVEAVPEALLFNLREDPGESHDLAEHGEAQVAALMLRVQLARARLGDYDRLGSSGRFFDPGEYRPAIARWRPRPPGVDRPVGRLRFDFESGVQGWRVVDGRITQPVSKRVGLEAWPDRPFGRQGAAHLSTLTGGGAAQRGVLESPLFVLEGDRMSMLVGGGAGPATYVALCDEKGSELLQSRGTNRPEMRRVLWDVAKFRGRRLKLRVVDRAAGSFGHVTFDDFSCAGRLAQ